MPDGAKKIWKTNILKIIGAKMIVDNTTYFPKNNISPKTSWNRLIIGNI